MTRDILASFESPYSLLNASLRYNDYPYLLAHLLEESGEYRIYARKAIESSEYSILDNSAFELGQAFDLDKYEIQVKKYKPSYHVIPDSIHDADGTMLLADDWISNRGHDPAKCIGVVQGKSMADAMRCYQYLDEELKVGILAIPYHLPFYVVADPLGYRLTAEERQSLGRASFISMLWECNVLNPFKDHHLLGCAALNEFAKYTDYGFIKSVDTSLPVICTLDGRVIGKERPPIKLMAYMGATNVNPVLLMRNIEHFKKSLRRNNVSDIDKVRQQTAFYKELTADTEDEPKEIEKLLDKVFARYARLRIPIKGSDNIKTQHYLCIEPATKPVGKSGKSLYRGWKLSWWTSNRHEVEFTHLDEAAEYLAGSVVWRNVKEYNKVSNVHEYIENLCEYMDACYFTQTNTEISATVRCDILGAIYGDTEAL